MEIKTKKIKATIVTKKPAHTAVASAGSPYRDCLREKIELLHTALNTKKPKNIKFSRQLSNLISKEDQKKILEKLNIKTNTLYFHNNHENFCFFVDGATIFCDDNDHHIKINMISIPNTKDDYGSTLETELYVAIFRAPNTIRLYNNSALRPVDKDTSITFQNVESYKKYKVGNVVSSKDHCVLSRAITNKGEYLGSFKSCMIKTIQVITVTTKNDTTKLMFLELYDFVEKDSYFVKLVIEYSLNL